MRTKNSKSAGKILISLVFAFVILFSCKKNERLISENIKTENLLEGAAGSNEGPRLNGNYIVVPAAGKSLNDVVADAVSLGATVLRIQTALNYVVVSSSTSNFKTLMEAKSSVGAVTPSYTFQSNPNETAKAYARGGIIPKTVFSNSNPLFPLQWSHLAIQSPHAWALGQKGDGARVAVCDGGFFPNHPDIKSNVNFLLSKNFVAGENLEQSFGGFSHGTHCAGIVAAVDNEIGVIGVAPEAELVLLKVLSDAGEGSFEDVAAGIVYAADNNADVISLSLAGYVPRNWKGETKYIRELINFMNKAVKYAIGKGSAVICAAANEGIHPSKEGYLISPVGAPGSIGISALGPLGFANNQSTNLDEFAFYSNFGIDIIDFSGSGGNIDFNLYPDGPWLADMVLSTSDVDGYWYAAGTSMATPQAAGVAALIIGKYGKMPPSQLKASMQQSSDDLGIKGQDELHGHGRVNAWKAVK